MWALWRRFVYSLTLLVLFLVPASYFLYTTYYKAPNCSDREQNGEEAGVDCGGSCSLICTSDILPIETRFASFFLNEDGTYDIGVLLLNKNTASAPENLKLTIVLKSKDDTILFQKDIETPVPLASEFPIVIERLKLLGVPDKVILIKEEGYSYTLKNKVTNPVKSQTVFDSVTKKGVYVTLTNTTKKDLLRFPVRVVLYDEVRKPLGVAETYVDRLPSGETKTVQAVLGKVFEKEPVIIRAFTVLNPYDF